MPDLEMLLRDVRPVPHPGWTAKLDARVAARFPGPAPRWKRPLIAFREHFLAIGAVATVASVLIVLVISGLSVDRGSDDAGSSGSSAAMPAGGSEEAASDSSDSSATAAPETAPGQAPKAMSGAGAAPFAREDRAVLSSATLTLSTSPDKVNTVSDQAIRVVDGLGGFVQSSEVNSSGSSASAVLTVKIPSDKLDAGLAQLSKLAHVKGRSQQALDVTDQREALEASVRDARADRAGLRVRLAKATTDAERTRLRAQLDRATRRVTQRQRRVNELGQAVSYATVELSIEGDRRGAAAPPVGRWTPGDALGDAVRVLEVIAGVLMIALAVLIPVALIALLGGAAGRIMVRRRRERALEMA